MSLTDYAVDVGNSFGPCKHRKMCERFDAASRAEHGHGFSFCKSCPYGCEFYEPLEYYELMDWANNCE